MVHLGRRFGSFVEMPTVQLLAWILECSYFNAAANSF